MTSKSSKTRSLAFFAFSAILSACGSSDNPMMMGPGAGPGPGPNGDVSVKACQATIAARTDQLKKEGIDVASWSIADAPEMAELTTPAPQTPANYKDYDGHYRPLQNHPGCDVTNLYYDRGNRDGKTPYVDGNNDGKWTAAAALGGPNAAKDFIPGDKAAIPGYPCAAKEYAQPNEDPQKPIVILVHGNSTRPHSFEKFLLPPGVMVNTALENVQFTADSSARDQLAERLVAARFRVIAVDFRTDLVTNFDPASNSGTENAAGNIDHGWAVPILQSLVKAVLTNNPKRKISLVAHSMAPTVTRDALRRLYVEFATGKAGAINPFPQVQHVILGSGANHGVSSYDPPSTLCGVNKTMRGTVVCEMGSRQNYVQTYFHKPLNGPRDLFSTPCADGDYAFGKTGQCGGNAVRYYTITMSDKTPGSNYQDFYVSQAASKLDMPGCVANQLTTLSDYDTSGYFLKGAIANHFGSVRSTAGVNLIVGYLQQ